jgi:hypothetical protein
MPSSYTIHRHGRNVHLRLRGHFKTDDAVAATTAFVDLIGEDVVRFVVDLGALEGYDKEARLLWQKILAPLRKQISMIYFIGDAPPLIRMAASAVALAVGVRMRFLKDLADLPAKDEK